MRLATAGVVVVDALNWYFPDNLSSDICEHLEKTDIPFGRAIKHLNPKRRTFLVRRCTPEQLVDARGSIDPTSTAFEHRAVVYREDGVPLAVVHERFRAILVFRVPELVRVSSPKPATASEAISSGGAIGSLGLAANGFRKRPYDFDVVTDPIVLSCR